MSASFAFVDRGRITEPSRHGVGLPAELADGRSPEPMPDPDVVVIVDHRDGPMLYRYTAGGEFAGDTWHGTIEDARAQAAWEYGDALGEWQDVPEGVSDAEAYVREAAANRAES
jgi:hypothetical protein